MSKAVIWDRASETGYQLTFQSTDSLVLSCETWQMKNLKFYDEDKSWTIEATDLVTPAGSDGKVRHRTLKLGAAPSGKEEPAEAAAWHVYLPVYLALRQFTQDLREDVELSESVFKGGNEALTKLCIAALEPYWKKVSLAEADALEPGSVGPTPVVLLEGGPVWPHTVDDWAQLIRDTL